MKTQLYSSFLPKFKSNTLRAWIKKTRMYDPHSFRALSTMSRPQVHVLGLGSIGTFAAHALAEAPGCPDVTLLLHRPALLDAYINNGRRISLETREGNTVHHTGYGFEMLNGGMWYGLAAQQAEKASQVNVSSLQPEAGPISNLILSVKASQTINALKPLQHRLGRHSNIVFLQNGTGMVEAVNENLFTDPGSRPNYVTGIISHGVGTTAPFRIVHTGASALSLGPIPRQDQQSIQKEGLGDDPDVHDAPSSYLIETLCSVPRLNAKAYKFTDVLQLQLEKLAVNAFSNPICALHDTSGAYLQTIPGIRRKLTAEISAVVLRLPELQGTPGIKDRFSAERLDKTVETIIEQNAKTICSMVWDMRAKRKTEIGFINGYWCRRGREVGVATPINDDLVMQVEARSVGW